MPAISGKYERKTAKYVDSESKYSLKRLKTKNKAILKI